MKRNALIALVAIPWAFLAAIVATLVWTQEIQAGQWRVQLSSAAEPQPAVLTQQLAEEKKSTRFLGQLVAQKDKDILALSQRLQEREAQVAEYKKREREVYQLWKEADEYRASVENWAKEYEAAVKRQAEDYKASIDKWAEDYKAGVLMRTGDLEAAVKKWQQEYEAYVQEYEANVQEYVQASQKAIAALQQNRDEWQRVAREYRQAAEYYARLAGFYASLSSMPRIVTCSTSFIGSIASTTCF